MKIYINFTEAKIIHLKLNKQQICNLLNIPYAFIRRIEHELSLPSAYVYDNGAISKKI